MGGKAGKGFSRLFPSFTGVLERRGEFPDLVHPLAHLMENFWQVPWPNEDECERPDEPPFSPTQQIKHRFWVFCVALWGGRQARPRFPQDPL